MKNNLVDRFLNARKSALSITSPLKLEDYVIQSRPEASPAKWHLAHTTWLYEKLLLENFEKNFIPFNRDYFYLFNSYYNSFGEQWNRNDRGNLSRPTLDEIIQYRKNVDQRVTDLDFNNSKLLELFTLAINHEEQHNELLLMDIKLNFFQQYPKVSYLNETIVKIENVKKIEKSEFKIFDEGLFEFGINKNEIFSYDNENPKHKVWLHPFAIYTNLVTNGEYLEFVESNGYKRSELWHSDV